MEEQEKLEAAVDKFAIAMKKRLNTKRRRGWHGWERPTHYNIGTRLLQNAAEGVIAKDKKSLVDTANLAMFLWQEK